MLKIRSGSIVFVLAAAAILVLAITAFASNDWHNLVFLDAIFNGDGGLVEGLSSPREIEVSPDGKHAYAASYASHAVVVFSRDADSGALTFLEVEEDGVGGVDGLQGANSVAVSPDGKNVYVSGTQENKLAVFTRDAVSGGLAFEQAIEDGVDLTTNMQVPDTVRISPDGGWVFVAASASSAVTCFVRNPSNGRLLYFDAVKNSDPGVDGLSATRYLAVSPDGKHLYAASFAADTVAILAHNGSTGALSYVGFVEDGVGGVDGLDGANGVAVSPDAAHVYVSGHNDDALAIFTRNSSTGALTYQRVVRNGVGNVDGLNGPRAPELSPDGLYVYVPAGDFVSGSLAMFARTSASGVLTFLDVAHDGVGPVVGLENAIGAGVSPDGRNVYTVSDSANSVASFLVSFTGFYKADPPPIPTAGGRSTEGPYTARVRTSR
jgi:6-phosphogluconolactonase (cycloisomerase 2 family)